MNDSILLGYSTPANRMTNVLTNLADSIPIQKTEEYFLYDNRLIDSDQCGFKLRC